MINNFMYMQPVKLHFGINKLEELASIAKENGFLRGILVCDAVFIKNGVCENLRKKCDAIVDVFFDFSPNPTLGEVERATKLIKEQKADFVIAMGGGSAIDLAKFACSNIFGKEDIREYFYGRAVFENKRLPLIAVPTTAGTGSEVTSVSVCNDERNGTKAPFNHPNFYPTMALLDPMLTLTVPPKVTADTGIDALAHALEGFWSVNHQPICDLFAQASCKLIFNNLERCYIDGKDVEARANMMLASLYSGLSFALPKTAGCHACSYPLSIDYNLSHGEACGFTLDSFVRINKVAENERLEGFARAVGFTNADSMASEIIRLKKAMGMKMTLQDCNIKEVDLLAEKCAVHPVMNNNPIKLNKAMLSEMFGQLDN